MTKPDDPNAPSCDRDEISVTGEGSASTLADIAYLRGSGAATRATVQEAVSASDDAVRWIRAALESAGVAGPDAATASFSIRPVYSTDRDGHRTITYSADQQLEVKTRDIDGVGALLGQIVAAGGDETQIHSFRVAIEDGTQVRREARESAWNDAVSRATQLASLAGRTLGEVRRISEGSPPELDPADRPRGNWMSAGGAAEDVSMEAGNVTIKSRVRVTWGLT
jgi:uncharacterized protein YggE